VTFAIHKDYPDNIWEKERQAINGCSKELFRAGQLQQRSTGKVDFQSFSFCVFPRAWEKQLPSSPTYIIKSLHPPYKIKPAVPSLLQAMKFQVYLSQMTDFLQS